MALMMTDGELNEKLSNLDIQGQCGPGGNEPSGPGSVEDEVGTSAAGAENVGRGAVELIKNSPFKAAVPPPPGTTAPFQTFDRSLGGFNGRRSSRLFDGIHRFGDGKLTVSTVELGDGGFGVVYEGKLETVHESQEVVVKDVCKMPIQDAWSVLENEIKIYESLPNHPNITKFLGSSIMCDENDDEEGPMDGFIVLERMPHNLHEALHTGLIKTFGDVVKILLGIAEGLHHLHKHGVVHFDLKPSNVLLTKDLIPKIVDFGVSKIRHRQSITLSVRGTYGYMAPELLSENYWNQQMFNQARNGGEKEKVKVSKLIDIFSFGKLAIDMIIGMRLYDQDKRESTINEGKFVEVGGLLQVKVPCECPAELRDLINSCLRYDDDDPEARLTGHGRPTPDEIVEMLKPMLDSEWIHDLVE